MSDISTKALLITGLDYGESDRILTLITEKLGKVRCIAKGARRSFKRFGGCLEPFTLIQAVIKRREGLSLLREVKHLRDFRHIKKDVDRMIMGSYLLELTAAMSSEGDLHKGDFELLLSGLERLEACSSPDEAVREYEVRLLKMTGYMPSFLSCISCGKGVSLMQEEALRPEGGVIFSLSKGGIVCRGCLSAGDDVVDHISIGTLKTLDLAARGRASFTKNALDESSRVLPAFISHHIGKRLKSLDFIEKMKGLD